MGRYKVELTPKQLAGLHEVVNRYRRGEKFSVISGYAGVGKSTLVKFIIDALEISPEAVRYVAYTGKASEVLRKKGNPNAMTAHKLLYYSKRMADGHFVYRERPHLEGNPALIVVDEVSMLPASMWNLLIKHPVHILALGDPFQIPPIHAKDDNHLLEKPHVFLDEVMRQAQESDIICLSMDIREGKFITPHMGHDANVVFKQDLFDGMYEWADQIICSTNRTRMNINRVVREINGFDPLPQVGDKVICLRNAWSTCSLIQENPLVNGSIGWITDIEEDEKEYLLGFGEKPITVPTYNICLETDDHDIYEDIIVDKLSLDEGKKFLTPRQEYLASKDKRNVWDLPLEFNYGSAITGHKAQGSQWGKVLVQEEDFPFDSVEHRRWLYTACTRPEDKLTLVLNQ